MFYFKALKRRKIIIILLLKSCEKRKKKLPFNPTYQLKKPQALRKKYEIKLNQEKIEKIIEKKIKKEKTYFVTSYNYFIIEQ